MRQNEKETLPQTTSGCLGAMLASIVGLWLAGLVIQYGWNNIIAEIFEIQKLTFWQAVGLDLVVTAITGTPRGNTEESWLKILAKIIFWYFVLWGLMWIVVSCL